MGQGIAAEEAQLDTMAIEWVALDLTEQSTYERC